MAKVPQVKAFTGTSVEVLNAIRNTASTNYRNFVPFAQDNAESVKKIGAIIMQYPALQNEFLNNLINRIGLVIVTNKLYSNPWRMFKKGILEMGESVEEIFVNIAKVSQFDPSVAEETVFQRQIPDVRATFHIMNYQKFYKDTISDDQLRQAFVSWDGVTDLIARIVNSMYTAAEYDEFLVMRYMLAYQIVCQKLYRFSLPAQSTFTDNAQYNREVATSIKALSNNFTFLSSEFNPAGVMTHTDKANQYLITTVDFDASLDVDSLAYAFNMDKIQFSGNRVIIPSFEFTKEEIERLKLIFSATNDPNGFTQNGEFVPFTDDMLGYLHNVKAVLVSGDYFRVYDNLIKFTEIYNSEGLYWNYNLHTWKTFSTSPFENAAVFVDGDARTPEVPEESAVSGYYDWDVEKFSVNSQTRVLTALMVQYGKDDRQRKHIPGTDGITIKTAYYNRDTSTWGAETEKQITAIMEDTTLPNSNFAWYWDINTGLTSDTVYICTCNYASQGDPYGRYQMDPAPSKTVYYYNGDDLPKYPGDNT